MTRSKAVEILQKLIVEGTENNPDLRDYLWDVDHEWEEAVGEAIAALNEMMDQ